MREPESEPLADLTATLSALLQTLRVLEFVGRHLNPEQLTDIVPAIGEPDATLRHALDRFDQPDAPGDDLATIRQAVRDAATAALAGFDGLRAASAAHDVRGAYRALRREAVALEALFPLAAILSPVHDFFLEQAARGNLPLPNPAPALTGIVHAANDRAARGGFSMIVPPSYRADTPSPLIVALHGGSGHGRAFLWNWVRSARSSNVIVACPTATGPTWALGGPDMDSPNIAHIVDFIRARWTIDPGKLLLTGMSDGGTFTLLSGLQAGSPFTHLAPFATGFHPMLAEMAAPARVRGLPIYLVHGALDWMFPVELAQTAHRMLRHVGASITYREISDLAHVYPRDENPALLDWLTGPRAYRTSPPAASDPTNGF